MTGWYRIAQTDTKRGFWTGVFHILANCRRSTRVTDTTFTISLMDYTGEAEVGILNTSHKLGPVATKVRLVRNIRDFNPENAQICYLDIFMD
jgi:hypothetical protein